LVYLGRRDQQIKLRGHRIELGEIEAALRQVSGASQVAVVVQKRNAGDTLIGFVTGSAQSASGGEQIDPQRWITDLRKRLPAYMVPAIIVPIAAMPLTPNGKIDRKAFSLVKEEDDTQAKASLASEAPRDLLEQWLANIWARRLGKKNVTYSAHFFEDLGGHSLVAFEIFSEIEKRLGIAMMLATLFQAPTVELLAAAIRRQRWKDSGHISMVSPGLADEVTYFIGNRPLMPVERVSLSEGRVMAIDIGSAPGSFDYCLREITSFEANKPSLVLIAPAAAAEESRKIVSELAQAGFPNVSLRIADFA
jgi:acyl carrier protein